MRRRDVITLAASAATLPLAGPLAAQAQQRERVRRIGVLMGWAEGDPDGSSYLKAFRQELARLGRVEGRNLRTVLRWTSDVDHIRGFAKELAGQRPDVILSVGTPATVALQRETRTVPIPIVFTNVWDPVGLGLVAGLPRPGGNFTGFSLPDGTIAGKWLQMLTEIAPSIRQVAVMYNPDPDAFAYAKHLLGPFEDAARALMVDTIDAPVRSEADIETIIDSIGREHGGLVVLVDSVLSERMQKIIAGANSNKVPTIAAFSSFAKEGGLLDYIPRQIDMFLGAAGYVDRILNGDKPADLPVQLPTRYELVINLKTAKALGLEVPLALGGLADEFIEE